MLCAPSLDAGDVGWPFEVVLVLRFGPPARLSLALALGTTGRLGAKALVPTVARIRSEEALAMQALTKASGRRHSGGKKTYPQGGTHPELQSTNPLPKKIREENGGRRKKRFS